MRSCTRITHALEGRGDHERAIQAGREGLARARQLGLARYAALPLAQNLAESLTSAGRWDEALQVIEETLSLDPAPAGRALPLVLRGQIAVARGEREPAARILRQLRSQAAGAAALSQLALPVACLTTMFRMDQGDPAGALAVLRPALTRHHGADPRYLWPLLIAGMRACADAGPARLPPPADSPAQLRPALERAAASLARGSRLEQAHAAVFAAEACRAAGHPDRAAWDDAAAAWESLGQPYPLAYALLRGAGAAAAAGHRDGASVRLQRAAELAGQLRAAPLQQQISRLARRARIEVTGEGEATTPVPFGLTGRELEVLRLLTAGRGNREIAAELFISPRTASVHVSNILGKLRVASRGEAAATAYRLHIFDPP